MKVTARIMLARGLFGGGLLVIAFAIAWWWLSYREVLAYDYLSLSQAGVCLVQDSVQARNVVVSIEAPSCPPHLHIDRALGGHRGIVCGRG